MTNPMAIALPLLVDQNLVGTCFIAAQKNRHVVLASSLHLVGSGTQFVAILPQHGGDLAQLQPYPVAEIKCINLTLAFVDPLLDLALFTFEIGASDAVPPVPRFITSIDEVVVGDEVLVVGYPWAVLGSCLETAHPCHVSAKGLRKHGLLGGRAEIILTVHSHPGSSGSPVIRRSDGKVVGILRGALAPPGMLAIGNLPIGTDSTVTFATAANQVAPLLTTLLSTIP